MISRNAGVDRSERRVIVITRGAISAELKEGEITEENIIPCFWSEH